MKKLTALLLTLILMLTACSGLFKDDPKVPDPLAEELRSSLAEYIGSEDFRSAVTGATTTQARVPMLYTRYISGEIYTEENAASFKNYLSFAGDIIRDGKVENSLYSSSRIAAQGWGSIIDYLYSFSLIFNQYEQYLCTAGGENEFEIYLDPIIDYIAFLDDWAANECVQTSIKPAPVSKYTLSTYLTNAISDYGRPTSSSHLELPKMKEIAMQLSELIGDGEGFEALCVELDRLNNYSSLSRSEQIALTNELRDKTYNLIPKITYAFGYSTNNIIPLTAAELGRRDITPFTDEKMLAYYNKDESGAYLSTGGTPNWVGFSGRPMAGALYRGNDRYDVVFEKTRQGYFPFTDGWNQPLDEMITLDRLCNYYNHTLTTGANVAPQFALLT